MGGGAEPKKSRLHRACVSLLVCSAGPLLLCSSLLASPCRIEEGVALVEAHRYAEGSSLLQPCAREDGRAAHYLGRAYLAEREQDRAIEWLERAVALDPKSSDFQLWLGRAYGQKAVKASVFQQPSLAGKVRKAFARAVELDPENLDARSSLMDYYLLAPGIMGGSVPKAREQAAEIRHRDALKGYGAFGHIAEYEKKFDTAAAEYQRAALEFPQKTEPYYWRASLAAEQKDNARAFDILESLLKTQPKEMNAYYQIGRLAALSGERLDRAQECLKVYLQHEPTPDEPSLAWAHFRLGNVYQKRGQRDLARNEYQAALRLDPGLKEATEAISKI